MTGALQMLLRFGDAWVGSAVRFLAAGAQTFVIVGQGFPGKRLGLGFLSLRIN